MTSQVGVSTKMFDISIKNFLEHTFYISYILVMACNHGTLIMRRL